LTRTPQTKNPNVWRRPKRRAPTTWPRPKRRAPDRTELDEYPDRLLGGPLGWPAPTSGVAGADAGLSDCAAWPWPSVGFTHTRWATGPLGHWPSGSLGRWATGPLPRPAENRRAEPRRRTRLFALARFFDHPATHSRPATPQAVWRSAEHTSELQSRFDLV